MTAIMNPIMGTKEWLLLVVLSVLWGGAFFLVGVVVKEVPPFTVVLSRSGLAAILVSTTPLFSVILTHLLTSEEHITPARMTGVLLRLWGVVLLIGLEALEA